MYPINKCFIAIKIASKYENQHFYCELILNYTKRNNSTTILIQISNQKHPHKKNYLPNSQIAIII